MYPKKFEALVECYRRLPGVGIKTAERYAFQTLEWDDETMDSWIHAFQNAKEGLKNVRYAATYRKMTHVIFVVIKVEIVRLYVLYKVQRMLSQWRKLKNTLEYIMC